MKKTELLERTRRGRAAWEALVASLTDQQITTETVNGPWTVKDLIAHIAWYEAEMLNIFRQRSFSGSDWWMLSNDERNQLIYDLNKDRSLEEVSRESGEIYAELIERYEALSDEDLLDPSRFPGMPSDWQPWQVFAANSCEHYEEHVPQLEAWVNDNV